MRSVKNAAYLLLPLSLGTYSYSSYAQSHRKKRTYIDKSHFSEYYNDFIKYNNLVVPDFCHKLKRDANINSFFFKSILRNVGGLDEFSIYMDRKLNDVVTNSTRVSKEDRQKMFDNSKIYCLFIPNNKVEEQQDTVNAGFTATLLDNMGGMLAFMACGNKSVATTSLAINYHKPMVTGQEYITEVSTKKIGQKNVILQGTIKDKEGTLFAEADLMFVQVDWKSMLLTNAMKSIKEKIFGNSQQNAPGKSEIELHVPDIVLDLESDHKRRFRVGETCAKFC